MKFPWHKYEELELQRRNTLQIFITNVCNLKCEGCFARKAMAGNEKNMSFEEYSQALETFIAKGGKQINLLGGEPLLHPELKRFVALNKEKEIKTTIYTNGYFLDKYSAEDLAGAKIRVSIYSEDGKVKNIANLPKTNLKFDANFMVSAKTTLKDLLDCAEYVEKNHMCDTFFIFSMRELDNPRQEFFDDTALTMPVLKYKELIHHFLNEYDGDLEIHVSKRGVFESTKTLPDTKCRFANYFIGGKIIQCPYDVVNVKYQPDYEFGKRHCQHNSTCLMSKIILKRKK
ncbi:MAG: radical SAM protein [Parcubacteria group bacterium]